MLLYFLSFHIGVHLFARSLDNHWILKPWNMARAVDTHICSDVDTIVRLAESIPKVRQNCLSVKRISVRSYIGRIFNKIRRLHTRRITYFYEPAIIPFNV